MVPALRTMAMSFGVIPFVAVSVVTTMSVVGMPLFNNHHFCVGRMDHLVATVVMPGTSGNQKQDSRYHQKMTDWPSASSLPESRYHG